MLPVAGLVVGPPVVDFEVLAAVVVPDPVSVVTDELSFVTVTVLFCDVIYAVPRTSTNTTKVTPSSSLLDI